MTGIGDESTPRVRSYLTYPITEQPKEVDMIIVSGHLSVAPAERDAYLADCVPIVEQARRTAGCLDFTLSADLLDAGRINILERWESLEAVEAFRGDGPPAEQAATILTADVAEYEVSGHRSLT
ncbi:MAG: putative quinol monooxygenase [Propionibacteriaceae bacterium]